MVTKVEKKLITQVSWEATPAYNDDDMLVIRRVITTTPKDSAGRTQWSQQERESLEMLTVTLEQAGDLAAAITQALAFQATDLLRERELPVMSGIDPENVEEHLETVHFSSLPRWVKEKDSEPSAVALAAVEQHQREHRTDPFGNGHRHGTVFGSHAGKEMT